MDVGLLADLAGVLGLVLSIGVFLLTRWERRKRVVIELESGDTSRFLRNADKEVIGEDTSILVVRATNLSGVPIVVDRESFVICGNGKSVSRWKCDWLGVDDIPAPLTPQSSFEVAVFKDAFEDLMGRKDLEPFMNTEQHRKTVIPVSAEFRELNGKKFSSQGYTYNFYVGEVERS